MILKYIATDEDHGKRAVDVLCSKTGMSRLMSKKIRLHGTLTRNGEFCRMIDHVSEGDVLEAQYWPEGKVKHELRRDPLLPVIYRDDWLLIVNKPAGLVTHPTYLHEKGSVTDRLADYPLHPVIRLDRDTSGVLPIALNGHAHHVITSNQMSKIYLGLIHGRLPQDNGIIDLPIARHPESILKRVVHPDGLEAKTKYQLCRYFPGLDVSLVRFLLVTGRTHQIRVHCEACGHPLLGDWLYGIAEQDRSTMSDSQILLESLFERQALHAAKLSFVHPLSLLPQTVTATLPDDFKNALKVIYKYCKNDINRQT